MEYYHSVSLDEKKCKGCTNCIKRCPTQAIRVRDGKARIMSERCIDCGECIRVCPYGAKRAATDPIFLLNNYRYNIALPAPTLYGQFNNLTDANFVLEALLEIGFDDVYEVGRGAEIVTDATRLLMRQGGLKTPVISTACPAIVRLLRVQYPDLCDNVLPLLSPMQVSAYLAKKSANRRTGIPMKEMGAFFITPCPAKVTDIVSPIGIEKSWVDHALSMADVYPRLLEKMRRDLEPRKIAQSGNMGAGWAYSGGEAISLAQDHYLAADGIENVMKVLDQLEDQRLGELEFVELNACPGGCVGGVLAVENGYVAKARIQRLRKNMPVSPSLPSIGEALPYMWWYDRLEYSGAIRLSSNLGEALSMMREIEELVKQLPGLDCGSCGAPTCRALAEDIVTGHSTLIDCVFILRKEATDAGFRLRDSIHPAEPSKSGDDASDTDTDKELP